LRKLATPIVVRLLAKFKCQNRQNIRILLYLVNRKLEECGWSLITLHAVATEKSKTKEMCDLQIGRLSNCDKIMSYLLSKTKSVCIRYVCIIKLHYGFLLKTTTAQGFKVSLCNIIHSLNFHSVSHVNRK
jgi:hypothetical protein